MSRSVMGALPARAHTRKSRNEDAGGFLQGLLWGLGFALAGAVLSLFLGAVIANGAADPDALFLPFGFGALIICALAGGLGIGLQCKNAVLPCALLGLGLVAGLFFEAEAREALTLGLGLGASLGLRAGFVTLICAAAALTQQMKEKIQSQPKRKRR